MSDTTSARAELPAELHRQAKAKMAIEGIDGWSALIERLVREWVGVAPRVVFADEVTKRGRGR
jgi:hypothetical protein